MTCISIDPAEARSAVQKGARLIDIRGADEFAREHIPGAANVPLDRMGPLAGDGLPVIFHCRSGMRTSANEARLVLVHAARTVIANGLDLLGVSAPERM